MNIKLPLFRLAFWFLASRLFVLIVAGLSLRLVPPGDFKVETEMTRWLFHWDATWYLSIVQNGYSYDPHAQSSVAFFPLYPLLIYLLGNVSPNLYLSGYLISNACLFFSCLLLWKLVARDYGSQALADRSVLFLLLCPVTVFYSSIYTEGLFLLLTLAVAWFAAERRWLAAGGAGFLAALSRPPGFLLSILIATEYGGRLLDRQKDVSKRAPVVWREVVTVLVALALPELALGLYSFYLYWKFGDPLAFFHTRKQWGCHLVAPWNVLWAAMGYHAFYIVWFYGALVTGLVLAGLGVVYRLRPSHLALVFVFLLLYCSNSILESIPRYLSILFPFYIVAAKVCLRLPWLEPWLLGASAALAALSVVLFVDGYWYT